MEDLTRRRKASEQLSIPPLELCEATDRVHARTKKVMNIYDKDGFPSFGSRDAYRPKSRRGNCRYVHKSAKAEHQVSARSPNRGDQFGVEPELHPSRQPTSKRPGLRGGPSQSTESFVHLFQLRLDKYVACMMWTQFTSQGKEGSVPFRPEQLIQSKFAALASRLRSAPFLVHRSAIPSFLRFDSENLLVLYIPDAVQNLACFVVRVSIFPFLRPLRAFDSASRTRALRANMASDHSKKLRGRGNQLFKEACDEHLAPVVRSGRFLKAGSFYTQALAASKSEDERAKCRKNLGAVHWKHAKMSLELYDDGQSSSLLHDRPPAFDLEKSIENYIAALRHGRASRQRREWTESIESTLEEMAESLLREHAWIAEADFLEKLCGVYQSSLQAGARSRAYEILLLAHVQLLHDEAVKELNRKAETTPTGANYSKCLSLLDRCNVPIEQVQRRARADTGTLEKAQSLKVSVDNCRAKCESIRAREAGKRFLQDFHRARDEDSRNYLLTCALDKFKEAEGHAKGVDAECEAEALVCSGDAYSEMKKEDKAQSYYTAVVKIAQNSDAVRRKGFYEKARAAANAWLRRMREGRPSAHLLAEIKPDLDKIEAEFKRVSTSDFLKYLYKSYPPRAKDGNYTLGEVGNAAQIRIAVRKSLLHYHPDRNAVGDDKWGVLCGEITKLLLQRHQANA